MFRIDQEIIIMLSGVFSLLIIAGIVGFVLARRVQSESGQKVIANLNARIRAWWIMYGIFAVSLLIGSIGSLILFGLLSFLALREFITLTPTHRKDHRTLSWLFFIVLPLQYYLVFIGWYGLFTLLIPVYAFLFIPLRSALAGETDHFLERVAKIQWGLMICVFCLSHAPALMLINIPHYEGEGSKLLVYLITIVQLSDVFQYIVGKLFGKHKIAPVVSPNKTWEGFIGGALICTAIGSQLWWLTPFTVWQSALMSLLLILMGFAGGLCMSAIKRDSGIKDFGTMLEGHGGILDRIDSICFSAPVFFHVINYFFTH